MPSKETADARSSLLSLPFDTYIEIPGRPSVVYQLRDYSERKHGQATTGGAGRYKHPSHFRSPGAKLCREDIPFLFKAFELGHPLPPVPGTKEAEGPRASTIHEYLDWTVSAAEAHGEDELGFDGFILIVLLPRYRQTHPPPGAAHELTDPPSHDKLGAPRGPVPPLMVHGKPISAATIRAGPTFLEVPFVATHETRKGRGYGRCLMEAIEDVARCLGKRTIMLCSTDDEKTMSIWNHFGYQKVDDATWDELEVDHNEMLYMDNTVQLYKPVPPCQPMASLLIRHQNFVQRVYYDLQAVLGKNKRRRQVLLDDEQEDSKSQQHQGCSSRSGSAPAPSSDTAPLANGGSSRRL